MTTYTAAIGTASDVVAGDFCDVIVVENMIVGFRYPGDVEVPEFGLSNTIALGEVDLDVRTDADDKLTTAPAAADKILTASGWTRTGDWETARNALYAPVERTN
jgi:hypothetical protein